MSSHPYAALTPERVLAAVEAVGLVPDGRVLALNSYENRVYQIGVEEGPPLVAKFYRPGRWGDEAIAEEHAYALELAQAEIPVVAPLAFAGRTLLAHAGFRYALYPRRGGRRPDLERREDLIRMGRFLGRLHAVGAVRPFYERFSLDPEHMGRAACRYLLERSFIPAHLLAAYTSLTEELLQAVEQRFALAGPLRRLRLHGDCHPGNILWTDEGPHFVDLDDACNGPAMQDLWMLLSGGREEQTRQLAALLTGYRDFADLDPGELWLIEPLRSLRMLHYSAWLARRWDDPAFPRAFPWFNTVRYWEDQVLGLREQLARLQEPPLSP